MGTVRAVASLIGDQASEASFGHHRLISDEATTIGGADTGPNPLNYFMAAIGFCLNVTFARYATLYGLDFDSLETRVRGHWDRRGQLDSSDIQPAFIDFFVEISVSSSDPAEEVKRVAAVAKRTCPMHSTISKVCRVVDRLYVNEVEIPF